MKKNFLYRKKKGNIINKISFITKKIYVEQYKTNNNIAMIQDNIKEFIKQKNYVDKNLIHKNKGIYYFEKVYLNYNNQKIIKFVKIMTHILQLLVFKKKIYYKNPNDYDVDDLNKVKYIQTNYLNHYYNNKPISLLRAKNGLDSNKMV